VDVAVRNGVSEGTCVAVKVGVLVGVSDGSKVAVQTRVAEGVERLEDWDFIPLYASELP
jgi:hypothetical protein